MDCLRFVRLFMVPPQDTQRGAFPRMRPSTSKLSNDYSVASQLCSRGITKTPYLHNDSKVAERRGPARKETLGS